MSAVAHRLPGGVGVSRLRVYGTAAPDGLVGGSAHVHLASDEAYVVVAGRGAVQTLGPGGFAELPLEPGAVVWFSPGVIHRLVGDGRLEIVVVMQNAGLPEAGDAVLTFSDDVLADPAAYAAAAGLPAGADDADAARRRDRAVEGFTALRRAVEATGPGALDRFYERAAALVRPHIGEWGERWDTGPRAATDEVGRRLRLLADGRADHLRDGAVHALPAGGTDQRLGMCGRLTVYEPASGTHG